MTLDIIEQAKNRIAQNDREIHRLLADNDRWQDFITQARELVGDHEPQSPATAAQMQAGAAGPQTPQGAATPTSLDRAEGIVDGQSIQPETADELPPASRGFVGEDDLREPAATVRGQIAQEGDAPLEAAATANGEGMSGHTAHLSTGLQTSSGKPVEAPASAAPAADDSLIDRIKEMHDRQPEWPAKLIGEALGVTVFKISAVSRCHGLGLPTQAEFEARRVAKITDTLKDAIQLQSQSVAPVSPPKPPTSRPAAKHARGQLFRLRTGNRDGKYLHQSCIGLVDDNAYAWKGTERQMVAVRARYKEALDMYEEPVL
jgi:hypothetical protein